MILGIEIGGTKLQWIVGSGSDTAWIARRLASVERERAAEGIRTQLVEITESLLAEYPEIERIGIGFGGPVDPTAGRVILSHQIDGWQDFPLASWLAEHTRRPVMLANDSDCAGLAEATYGAGRGEHSVFYSNVGSGIGGALIIDGNLYTGGSGIASEIGHLRLMPYGLAECDMAAFSAVTASFADPATPTRTITSDSPHSPSLIAPPRNVESMASGWAITKYVQKRCQREPYSAAAQAIGRAIGETNVGTFESLDTRLVVQLALEERNPIALAAMNRCTRVYGWAIAQMITLLAPNVVVIGGGVSLADERIFLGPLRERVAENVLPALQGSYRVEPARLGEEVVAAGAIALAALAVNAPGKDNPK